MAEQKSGITKWVLLSAFALVFLYWLNQSFQKTVAVKSSAKPVATQAAPTIPTILTTDPVMPSDSMDDEGVANLGADLQAQTPTLNAGAPSHNIPNQAISPPVPGATNNNTLKAQVPNPVVPNAGVEPGQVGEASRNAAAAPVAAPAGKVVLANPVPSEEEALVRIMEANKQRKELNKAVEHREREIDRIQQAIVDSGFKNPYDIPPREIDIPLVDPPAEIVEKLKNHELVGH